jgi:hypothetical protein
MAKSTMKLMLVEWVDSSSTRQPWREVGAFGPEAAEPLRCQTVGWLMASHQNGITLAMNIGYEAGQHPHTAGNDMTIPRVAIRRMVHLPWKKPHG